MPIANCLVSDVKVSTDKLDRIVSAWANIAGVGAKDICLNIISDFMQAGQHYRALINLYLPSLWTDRDIQKIQMGLLHVLCKHLDVAEEQVFIMTSIVQSGHVVENGKTVEW